MEARLPADKIEKCTLLISSFLRRKKVTLQEIQSLTGLLNFACSVVVPGRAFLSAHYFVRLTKWIKADLSMWQSFLDYFNWRSFLLRLSVGRGGVINSPRFCFFLLRLPVGRGEVINSPRSVFLCFFFRCSKLGYRSWVIPLCILLSEPVSPRLFNSIPSKLCHQNTHFNMYTTTSKQQEEKVLRAKIRIKTVL